MNAAAYLLAWAHDQRNMLRVARRQLRDNTDPFLVPEARFIELFRFNKDTAISLLSEISPFMKEGVRNTFIPKSLRMLVVLHYYATGSFYRDVGQDFVCPMSKTMICRSIQELTYIIEDKLMDKYIRFPTTTEQQSSIRRRFFDCTGFPGAIGAIDCTHIKIKKPSNDVEYCYINRKGFFSKNVQLICDFDLNILACYARFGGSTHDAFIWENCKVKEYLEIQYERNGNTNWLIGDSGYPLQPWLMTPHRNPITASEESFNTQHIKAGNCIERLNGVLKKVFACLSHDRGLLVSPSYSGAIINACCTLHNYRKNHNLPLPAVDIVQEDTLQPDNSENQNINPTTLNQAKRIRENIVRNYF